MMANGVIECQPVISVVIINRLIQIYQCFTSIQPTFRLADASTDGVVSLGIQMPQLS